MTRNPASCPSMTRHLPIQESSMSRNNPKLDLKLAA